MERGTVLNEETILHTHETKSRPCLRSPQQLMFAQNIGAFHASYISFSRSLVRTMIREKWRIQKTVFDLDEQG